MKKLLATILSVIICVSLFTVPTFAASGPNGWNYGEKLNYQSTPSSIYFKPPFWINRLTDKYGAKAYEDLEKACLKGEVMLAPLYVMEESLIRQGQAPLSSSSELDFGDVNMLSSSAIKYAKVLKEYGILTGDSANNMKLQNDITRAEAAQIIVKFSEKFLGMPEVNDEKAYSDVSTNHWAAQYISYTRRTGLMYELGDNKFYPDRTFTIDQLFASLDRMVGYGGIEQIDVANAMNDMFKITMNNMTDLKTDLGSSQIAVTTEVVSLNILKDEEKEIQLILLPKSIRDIQVVSQDTSIVKIVSIDQDNDTVTIQGVSGGTTYIELCVEGASDSYTTLAAVFVSNSSTGIPVEEMTIIKYLDISIGEKFPLEADISPSDATDKSVTWYSENEKVVTIDSTGMVTGVGKGRIFIIATTGSGLKAWCMVTVS